MGDLESLSKNIGYKFSDVSLLEIALTHRSESSNHNERLEFLGDSIVNFVIADALYQQFHKASEGDLSRLRATLINRETLGELAKLFNLGMFIRLGAGEIKTGGNKRISILSCAMEAIIGAIYLDGGFHNVKSVILGWYKQRLSVMPPAQTLKDPKTQLQELLQADSIPLPVYKVESQEGLTHCQTFTVSCTVEKIQVSATGLSRRRAEQAAATKMLEKKLTSKK